MDEPLADDIENDIIFGVFSPGVRLTEDRVMERYDVKRHAARTAFSELERRGLLVHKANRGVEVVDFTPDEVDELYGIRIILETAAARQTPLPVAKSVLAEMTDLAKNHEKSWLDGDFRAVFDLNKAFHKTQFSVCGNQRLIALIEEHARMAQTVRVVKYQDAEHMRQVVEQHFQIIDAMGSADQDVYVEATLNHLPASAEAYRAMYTQRFGLRRSA